MKKIELLILNKLTKKKKTRISIKFFNKKKKKKMLLWRINKLLKAGYKIRNS